MNRKLLLPAALAAVVALAGCDGSATTPADDSGLSRTDVQFLAGESGDQDGFMLDGFGSPGFSIFPQDGPQATTTTVTTSFTRTRTCPAGGTVKLEGTVTHSGDPATHTGSFQFNATRTEAACAFTRNGNTITITGNPSTTLTASASMTNGVPGLRTATKKGSFNWTKSTGKSGTCSVDLTATWDPATKTLHVAGTFCNQTVDVTRTWTQSNG